MSTEPRPGLVPEHLRTRYQGAPVRLTVDRQDFRVRVRADEPGTYDFDWLSGPQGYGLGPSRSADQAMSRPEIEDAIREFLAEIDTGAGLLGVAGAPLG